MWGAVCIANKTAELVMNFFWVCQCKISVTIICMKIKYEWIIFRHQGLYKLYIVLCWSHSVAHKRNGCCNWRISPIECVEVDWSLTVCIHVYLLWILCMFSLHLLIHAFSLLFDYACSKPYITRGELFWIQKLLNATTSTLVIDIAILTASNSTHVPKVTSHCNLCTVTCGIYCIIMYVLIF